MGEVVLLAAMEVTNQIKLLSGHIFGHKISIDETSASDSHKRQDF